MNRRAWLLAPLAAAVLAVSGCASFESPKNIVATAASNPEFSTLAKLIGDAGLTETLSGPGPFTVFAPTNAAFAKVPAKTMAELAADKARLTAVLTFHVVPGSLMAADVKQGNVKTVQGANLALSRAGTFVTVEDAMVTKADIKATNGVIHAIDTVLIPPAPRR
ncbi:MAG: fasciclin domain-containing protein [Burkholderiaceae bacterium]|jgi:uncharacterized surface protein with fasciclin (FAS1) repeats|nr:fasciclin domain-containing protein [Burkholderiaceae bacterium]